MMPANFNYSVLVTRALDEAGIPHGAIHAHSVQRNFSYTDGSAVFCKVLRPGTDCSDLQTELRIALHYGSQHMLEPLHPKLLTVGDTLMSVWRWETMAGLTPHLSDPAEIEAAAFSLHELHSLKPTGLQLNRMTAFPTAYLDRRVANAIMDGFPLDSARQLLMLRDSHLLEPISAEHYVLVHGDAHVRNAAYRERHQRVMWHDFEEARFAPRELDVVTLYIDLVLVNHNLEAWARVKDALNFDALDEGLFRRFAINRLLVMASFSLLYPERLDIAREQVARLSPLLSDGELPTDFPR